MVGLLDNWGTGVNNWFTGQDMAGQGPYAPEDYASARRNLLGGLGGLMLAAGQPMTGAQRGQIFSQIPGVTGNYQNDLMSGYKNRQFVEEEQENEKFDRMMKSGDLSQFGFNENQITILRGMPRATRNKILEEAMTSQFTNKGANDGVYGVGYWGQDEKGNWVLMQTSKQAGEGLQIAQTPEGIKLVSPGEQAGLKTAAQTRAEIQEKTGSQINDVQTSMDMMNNTIDSLLTDKEGLSWYGGTWGAQTTVSPKISQSGYNYAQRVETLRNQYFPIAITAMVGLGALSNAEGQALTGQLGSLEPGQGDQQTLQTLRSIRQFLAAKMENYQAKAGQIPGGGGGATSGITIEEIPE